ncbi:ABC transporter, extracellular substrate binding protein [Bifidobacterium sp. DSM 109958]|uniref:ABC transporter, extracellular substrate binding protein n=1 Tax=Bifidobacterium moraviense TaxID=2675323 RepID=A0A7Y0I017_9BIFI|nr:extracellular solute-binding protein [Bifidobacterium sp. DSM 109958]NMN00983.1 ABC transporter, extracellular substrate binding protein [Bifidobacterium sp. DSM 109958]
MNKHIRKALAIAAAGATIFSMAACGSSNGGSGDPGKLTVAWWGNQTRNDLQAKVDKAFGEANGVTIDGQFSQWADYWQKMSTNAAGKSLPDVFAMDFSYLTQYIDNGLLEPLDDYISSGKLDMSNVDENTLSAGKGTDGKIYAIPSGVNAPTFIVNQGLLDELGITIPDNWTLDDFMDIARQVYEKSGVKTEYGFGGDAYNLEYVMRAHDAKLFDGENLGSEDASAYEEYFNVWETMYKEGWGISAEQYTEITLGSVEQDPLVSFTSKDKQAWNSLAWNSQLTAYSKVNPDLKLALYPWPSSNVKKSNYVHPGQYWAVAKTSKNKDMAVKFIDYYTNNDEAVKTMLLDRGIPISSKALETITPSLSDNEKTIVKYQEGVPANSSPINQPMPSKATEVNKKIMPDLQEQIMYGKMTASQAAQDFITRAKDSLK